MVGQDANGYQGRLLDQYHTMFSLMMDDNSVVIKISLESELAHESETLELKSESSCGYFHPNTFTE